MAASRSGVPPNRDEVLGRIAAITHASLAHMESDALTDEVLDRVRELLEADTAAVLLMDASEQYLTAVAAKGIEEEVHQGARIPVGRGFAGKIAATRAPVIIEDVDHADVLNPVLRQKRIRSLLGVPLVVAGNILGVLHVGSLAPREFTTEEAELLQLAADRVALVTAAAQSRADQTAAKALQRSLVPPTPPNLEGYELAARYVPGQGTVGGDWYDVFRLPSGAVGLAVGDVAGSGLSAAVVMGRLRSALRAYALKSENPAEVLTNLDEKVRHFEVGAMATVIYVVADPGSDQLRISVAGHPLPILARENEEASVLELPVDPPMGVKASRPRRTTVVPFPECTLACFYTDGLIERRHENLDIGLEKLRAAVTADHPDTVCANVMNLLIGNQPSRDDTALLAVRVIPK